MEQQSVTEPLQLEKITIETFGLRERANDAWCLLKMAALVLFTGSAELVFIPPGEDQDPSHRDVPVDLFPRRSEPRNVAGRRTEKQWRPRVP